MNIDIIKSVSLTLTEMATIGDLPDLPLLRIFSLLQYPNIISASQTCLRWASLCHPLWAKIAEEIVESWSLEKFIPSEENIRIATILGMIRFMGLLHYNFKTTNKTTTSNRYIKYPHRIKSFSQSNQATSALIQ